VLAQAGLEALEVGIAVLAVTVVALIRRLITHDDRLRRLAERITYLEAKVNGKSSFEP
jgi:hypothetical protein